MIAQVCAFFPGRLYCTICLGVIAFTCVCDPIDGLIVLSTFFQKILPENAKEVAMKNILIISGHPNLQQSTANRAILDELAGRLPHAQIRHLDALYL